MKQFYLIASCALLTATAPNILANDNKNNGFNPKFSVILDGRYSQYENDPEEFEVPGFSLGGEAELPEEGFTLGHIEVSASAEIDDKLHGKLTFAIAEHDNETEIELEEAYIETLGLGNGFTVRAGRFFPSIGRVNSQHNHAWDFIDAPLVYQGLWGAKYIDDGLRLSWLAPTDTFMEFGIEGLANAGFPAGGERSNGIDSKVLFANLGGDINTSSSWQAGVSYHTADVIDRESGGHGHGHEGEGEEGGEETPSFSGDSNTVGLNAVYKWAPNGNAKNKHFILQAEYFQRDEDGTIELEGSDPLEVSSIDGDQSGFYMQGIYKFAPHWRAGVRYDRLKSNNTGNDLEVLEETELATNARPKRYSVMTEWVPSEFSRIRLQYSEYDSGENKDSQWFLQFTTSLGAHGAHNF